MSDIAFARSLMGGKRTSKIEARVTDDTKARLQQRCHELGLSESDYLDRLVTVNLFGLDHVLSLEQERTRKVLGMSVDAQTGAST